LRQIAPFCIQCTGVESVPGARLPGTDGSRRTRPGFSVAENGPDCGSLLISVRMRAPLPHT
jgi:hypothetical protein